MSHPTDPGGGSSVQLDQRLAEDAISALNDAVRLLHGHTTTDLGNAHKALDGWEGHHADTFTHGDLPWVRNESTRVLDGMLKLAVAIARAADSAQSMKQPAAAPQETLHGPR